MLWSAGVRARFPHSKEMTYRIIWEFRVADEQRAQRIDEQTKSLTLTERRL